jgi:membrane associated rhomboid family serine protease
MVIPIGDRNPTRRRPWVTWLLLAINIGVFVLVQPWWAHPCEHVDFMLEWATVPAEVTQGHPLTGEQLAASPPAAACGIDPSPDKSVYAGVLYSMFLHGGWLHLLLNMLYLAIFGNNVEDRLGHLPYLGFYLVTGTVATVAFVGQNPDSTATLVGASGAIAGVLGAYLVMFPRARVTVTVPFLLFIIVELPAVVVLGMWFLLQLHQLFAPAGTGGAVAYLAHVAGFAAGVIITLVLGFRPQRPRQRRA